MLSRPARLIGGLLIFAALSFATLTGAQAGPPLLTDDPEPIPYRHSEFYMFSTLNTGDTGKTIQAPAAEINYGFAPDFMVHMVVPYAFFYPDAGPTGRGLGDVELGLKYQFLQATA
ncbi:MAG: hypothetical protein KGL13_02975 [Gammaproteobacteria bacterium]|nr:hypothetical protein [Gammaproteobacteria bacterium]MDE2345411.1 hypothetical protein [Gammaproteobacteria bacterium]